MEKKKARLDLRISEALKQKLNVEADRLEITVTELLRYAIRDYFNKK